MNDNKNLITAIVGIDIFFFVAANWNILGPILVFIGIFVVCSYFSNKLRSENKKISNGILF